MVLGCIDTIGVILSDSRNIDAGQSEDPKKMPCPSYLYKVKTENNLGKSVLCGMPVTFA